MRRALLVLALLCAAAPARAHEILHAIERGRAIAVKAYFADGEVLAYTEYQVFSPADPKIPYQKGRTDRSGYLAFVPDAPGKWRVVITDASGHGLDIFVDATGPGATKAASAPVASWAFLARPVVGVLVIVALFTALVLIYRKKKS